jgi:transmembrane protein 132
MFISVAGISRAVEVHFENKDGGFFLKHVNSDTGSGGDAESSDVGGDQIQDGQEEAILSEEHFTVLQNSQPVSIRATYGPFSTKQTVPARYIVPDAIDVLPPPSASSAASSSPIMTDTAPTSTLDLDLYTHNLDISAHLVTPQIPRDSPVLRVLFHTGQQPNSVGVSTSSTAGVTASVGRNNRQRVCIVLYASLGERPSEAAACSPGGDDGVCLAQLTIPASWWPPLPGPDYFSEPPHESKPANKIPRRMVRIAYSVFEPRGSEPCAPTPSARVQIQPVTSLGAVPLVSAVAPYRELRADPGLAMLLPHAALYPRSRFYIPLFVQPRPGTNAVTVLVIRYVLISQYYYFTLHNLPHILFK